MKLADVKIGTQLVLGLGIILILVILLGGMAYVQAGRLWQNTANLYDHPLTVSRATRDLKIDILLMHRAMKDLLLAQDEAERQVYIQAIDSYETDAYRQFDIVYDRYLGERADINAAYDSFRQWKSIRDETIRLLRAGDAAGAAARVKTTGVGGAHVEKMMVEVQKIIDFAKGKADDFYAAAQKERDTLSLRLGIMFTAILLLSLTVSYLLLKAIRDPLTELTRASTLFRQGNLDARSHYTSANEFGTLSATFNDLTENVEKEILFKENAAHLAEVMLRADDLHSLSKDLLNTLLYHTSSQIGALYLLSDDETAFVLYQSIGLEASRCKTFSAINLEGEFGAALVSGQIQCISEIPADTPFNFSTVSGDFRPREIITVPILSGAQVVAMISLASLQPYSDMALRLINNTWSVITARLNGVLATRQIQVFSQKLEIQNRELAEQSKELAVQANELHEQNIELELQKNQLDEANRLKSVFLSNMSHELRTPLNSVIALAGVLNRRLRNAIPDEEYSYLEVIERNGKHLLELINDILDLSRIEAGREEIVLEQFSVEDLVQAVVAMIAPQAREKNIALLINADGNLPPITTDYAKCRHILQNIVANAVKFTHEGQVEISAARFGDHLHIRVKDSGIGIAPDQIPSIFDEFRQADERTSRVYGGTGLGLSIARKYARLLQGSIEVESEPGKGSTFTIILPLNMTEQAINDQPVEALQYVTPAGAVHTPVTGNCAGRTILLVEDSEPAIIQLSDILAEQGYQVRVARNGREALDEFSEANEKPLPDAIVLDLMMPHLDGFEVLRQLRKVSRTACLPVLILTAKDISQEELATLSSNNVFQLIQKGDVSKKELLATIEKMTSPRSEVTAPAEKRPSRPPDSGQISILVIEDNPDNLMTTRALLKDKYTIIEASSGQAGIEQAWTRRPDVILLDVSLATIDGYRLLKMIRENEALCHIPVIALTARAMKGDREQILAYGFDGYISRPIDKEQLEGTIQEVVYGS